MLEPTLRLGDLLVQRRATTPQQVEAMLALQARSGGRLGSLMVKNGLVSVRQVGEALAAQHGVPAADPAAFQRVRPGALGAVPKDLCARHGVFPLELVNGTLHLAMRDPQQIDLIDHLGRALGVTIQPYAVPELRLYYYLEQHYQIARPAAYRRQRTPVQAPSTPIAPTPSPPAAVISLANEREETIPFAGEEENSELVYLDQFDFGASTPEPETLEVEIDVDLDVDLDVDGRGGGTIPTTLPALVEQLDRANNRERVVGLLLRPPLATVTVSVVLLPRGELVRALGAWGTPLPAVDVRRLVLPLIAGSLLRQAFETRQVVCGPAVDDAVQPMIASYLRVPVPQQCCVAPVCVGRRVVNLLCYQSPADFVPDDAIGFSRMAEAAAAAYRRLIVAQKRS